MLIRLADQDELKAVIDRAGPIALLFVIEKQWRGLLVGLALLAGLSLVACAWTGISPLAMVDHW